MSVELPDWRTQGIPAPAAEALERVWNAAVDAATSEDYITDDGEDDEEMYLRTKMRVITEAWSAVRLAVEERRANDPHHD